MTPLELVRRIYSTQTDPGPEPVRLTLVAYGEPIGDVIVPADSAPQIAMQIGKQADHFWKMKYVFATRVPQQSETEPEITSHQLYP